MSGNGKDAFSKVLEKLEELESAVSEQRSATRTLLEAAATVNTSVAALHERAMGVQVAVNALGMVMRSYSTDLERRVSALEAKG